MEDMELHKILKPGMKVRFIYNPRCDCTVCQSLSGRIVEIDEVEGSETAVVSVSFKGASSLHYPLDFIEEVYPEEYKKVPEELFQI